MTTADGISVLAMAEAFQVIREMSELIGGDSSNIEAHSLHKLCCSAVEMKDEVTRLLRSVEGPGTVDLKELSAIAMAAVIATKQFNTVVALDITVTDHVHYVRVQQHYQTYFDAKKVEYEAALKTVIGNLEHALGKSVHALNNLVGGGKDSERCPGRQMSTS
jgi:hypothetical protein